MLGSLKTIPGHPVSGTGKMNTPAVLVPQPLYCQHILPNPPECLMKTSAIPSLAPVGPRRFQVDFSQQCAHHSHLHNVDCDSDYALVCSRAKFRPETI